MALSAEKWELLKTKQFNHRIAACCLCLKNNILIKQSQWIVDGFADEVTKVIFFKLLLHESFVCTFLLWRNSVPELILFSAFAFNWIKLQITQLAVSNLSFPRAFYCNLFPRHFYMWVTLYCSDLKFAIRCQRNANIFSPDMKSFLEILSKIVFCASPNWIKMGKMRT